MSSLTAADLELEIHAEVEPLDVLDLPQLYTRPSAKTLLATLADLSSEPTSWVNSPRSGSPMLRSGAATPSKKKRKIRSEGIPTYLTKIISSRLAWIEDDTEKESVWEAASQRLSERSGRTAMGDISRTFSIPLEHSADPAEPYDGEVLDIALHEPALTADNLGLKTWASSFLLAQRISLLRWQLPALPDDATVLELGAGTGLVGLAAAAVLQRHVLLTDLPEIVPNLDHNARANSALLSRHNGNVACAVLDWSKPAELSGVDAEENHPTGQFLLILVADPIYSAEHPRLLVQAIDAQLSKEQDARVVIELPLREAYAAERKDLRDRMGQIGLVVDHEGEEVGYDDWSSGQDEDELTEVRCWWSIWRWQ